MPTSHMPKPFPDHVSLRTLGKAASGHFFQPATRLGITGLARAGKTVFITSLVHNITAQSRMGQLAALSEGRLEAAFLQPQPDDTVPRFAYEQHRDLILQNPACWPSSTRSISQLRLSFRTHGTGLIAGVRGARVQHLDIVDYPGEWLLDLALLDMTYAQWSGQILQTLAGRPVLGKRWRGLMQDLDQAQPLDEPLAQELADAFTEYLTECRAAGFANITPGRFLLPGELAGSPALTFAPLPALQAPANSLHRTFERRFSAYRDQVIKPFFRSHFARIDRQIVLVDLLSALDRGPAALADLRIALSGVLRAFRPGRNSWLSRILGRRVDRILFAATKADHIHQSQHERLSLLLKALVEEAAAHAKFSGATVETLAIASLRATAEQQLQKGGDMLPVVRGVRLCDRMPVAVHPGTLPQDPATLLKEAQTPERWQDTSFASVPFAPPAIQDSMGGFPHIRLDRAAQFLFGDKL